MLKTDLHTHSIASGHALNTVYELAIEAKNKEVSLLGIVEHGPLMEGAPHEGYFWVSNQLDELYGVRLLLGVEANILNDRGEIDLKDEEIIKKQSLVLAGLHARTPYEKGDYDHTQSVVSAMRNNFVHVISHPYRERFPINIEKVVEAACRTGTLLELNNQVFKNESSNQIFLEAYKKMVDLCRKYGHPLVIGSDAHVAKDVGNDKCVMAVKSEIGLLDDMVLNNNPEELLKWIKK